jgi:hypothetical protein
MPSFIERVDDPQIPPPYDLPGIEIRSFELAADLQKMRALCDRMLNIGSLDDRGFEYRPLPLPVVALEVLTYPHMSSETPPFSNWGYITQQEVYIRFPVVKYDLFPLGQFLVPVEVSNFFPFIFVDNAWSAFSGREVIGMRKTIGTIGQQTAADQSYSASLNLPVFETHTPGTVQTMQEVVGIQTGVPTGAPSGPLVLGWPWLLKTADELSSLLLQVLELIDPGLFSTVQLKQIRDAEVPTEACFQGIVRSEFSVANPTVPVLFQSAQVTLPPFASLRMAEELGLSAAQPIEAAVAYAMGCDMRLGATRNLFERRDEGATAALASISAGISELLADAAALEA